MKQEKLDFSIEHDGLRYLLRKRLGLLRPGGLMTARRVVIYILLTWLPLLVFSLIDSRDEIQGTLSFLTDFSVHVRFLLTLPLLLMADELIDVQFQTTARRFYENGLIPPERHSAFKSLAEFCQTWIDSRRVEGVLLLVVFGLVVLEAVKGKTLAGGFSWEILSSAEGSRVSLAGRWYSWVSLPIYRFLIMSWLWQYLVWVRFLWGVSRFPIFTTATHPDEAGGLGFLGFVQSRFSLVIFALSANVSSVIGMTVLHQGAALESYRNAVAGYLIFILCLFLGPLLFFSRLMWMIKLKGLYDYGLLSKRYMDQFDAKWVKAEAPKGESLLGSSDIQSLADMGNSYKFVLGMRFLPFERLTFIVLAASAVIPFLPLALLRYPVNELLAQIFKMVF